MMNEHFDVVQSAKMISRTFLCVHTYCACNCEFSRWRIWGETRQNKREVFIYKVKHTNIKIDNYLTIFCRLTIMIFTLLFLLTALRQLKKWKHKIVMCKIARSERECTIQWQYIIFFLAATHNYTCNLFHVWFSKSVLSALILFYYFLNWLNDFESAFFGIDFKHFFELCSKDLLFS